VALDNIQTHSKHTSEKNMTYLEILAAPQQARLAKIVAENHMIEGQDGLILCVGQSTFYDACAMHFDEESSVYQVREYFIEDVCNLSYMSEVSFSEFEQRAVFYFETKEQLHAFYTAKLADNHF
jgi:hypothetical protein